MKMKKMAVLLTALALGAFAAHAGAAEISSSGYATVNAAMEALADGDTLVIAEDSSFNDEMLDKFDVDAGKNVTLDLNGKTLTYGKGIITTFNVSGGLTIKDSIGGGKLVLGANDIAVSAGASLIVESGNLTSSGKYLITASGDSTDGGAVTINGGTIEAANEAITLSFNTKLNINGGAVKGDIRVSTANETVPLCVIKISGGTVDGKFVVLGEGIKTHDMEVTGGSFTDASYMEYVKEGCEITQTADGYTVAGKTAAVTLDTKNVSRATVDKTAATGFVTTISSEEAFNLETVKWAVTYNNETRETGEYKLSGTVTVGGDATIGLVVDGFADASAEASATVNGNIKEGGDL